MSKPKLPPNGFEPGKTYRFRTLVDDAIGMGEPAGTTFSASSSDWNVKFGDRREPSCMTCAHPARWIDRGDIEWLPDLYGNEEDE